MGPVELSPEYLATRRSLHRVATHVLARARWARSGRFGLRVLPGGFGTPQFDDETVLRVSGGWLLHERRDGDSASTSVVELDGATLDELAAFVGIAFADGFSVGHDTPELGETTERLIVDRAAVATFDFWMGAGAAAVDHAAAGLEATVLQLWPEHFDAGVDLATPSGRCNLGMSAGDGFSAAPYAYVGPWEATRPGRADYWNAPFGAVASATTLARTGDVRAALAVFFDEGLRSMGVGA